LWEITSVDNTIDKKLSKFGSDKIIIKNYKQAIIDLTNSEDPTKLGDRKHGRFKYCYGYNITKSIRLLYRVFFKEKVIQLIDLDDHKNLFGRDNRS